MDNISDREHTVPLSVPTLDDGNEYQRVASEWLRSCMLGVASTNAAMASWLQLTCAAISLHTSASCSNPAARANTRRAVIQNITQSEIRCKDLLRISPVGFDVLLNKVKSNSKFKNFCRGSIEEQLIAFLLIVGHNLKNRVVSFWLCRSGETISRYFHNILCSVITLEDVYVLPAKGEYVDPTILNSPKFFPFFKDCLGAIDGTHVRVKVSHVDAPRYRGRKEWPTQNVLAACTFDLKFTYILAGWEGSASDARILQNALTRQEPLVIPDGKYYLGDAGFGLTSKILTPYGRTRYHLKEYSHHPPETPEELFNHRHSSLRNAIERAFGVMKKRFPIIASGSECNYSSSTMTNIVLACGVLHNFLLSRADEEDSSSSEEGVESNNGVDNSQVASQMLPERNTALEFMMGQQLRDRIASDMWRDYQASR